MTLEEYTQISGSQDTFCYWLEIKLQHMGNIAGGSAFKFGIFSRKAKSDKEDGGGASYSDDYAWYSKYGASGTGGLRQGPRPRCPCGRGPQRKAIYRLSRMPTLARRPNGRSPSTIRIVTSPASSTFSCSARSWSFSACRALVTQ